MFSFFSMFQKACFLWFKLLRHILFMLFRILKASFLIQIAFVSFSRVTFGRSIIWLFNSSTCEVIRPKLFKTVSLVEFLSWRQFSRNSMKNVRVSRKFSLRRISCSRAWEKTKRGFLFWNINPFLMIWNYANCSRVLRITRAIIIVITITSVT